MSASCESKTGLQGPHNSYTSEKKSGELSKNSQWKAFRDGLVKKLQGFPPDYHFKVLCMNAVMPRDMVIRWKRVIFDMGEAKRKADESAKRIQVDMVRLAKNEVLECMIYEIWENVTVFKGKLDRQRYERLYLALYQLLQDPNGDREDLEYLEEDWGIDSRGADHVPQTVFERAMFCLAWIGVTEYKQDDNIIIKEAQAYCDFLGRLCTYLISRMDAKSDDKKGMLYEKTLGNITERRELEIEMERQQELQAILPNDISLNEPNKRMFDLSSEDAAREEFDRFLKEELQRNIEAARFKLEGEFDTHPLLHKNDCHTTTERVEESEEAKTNIAPLRGKKFEEMVPNIEEMFRPAKSLTSPFLKKGKVQNQQQETEEEGEHHTSINPRTNFQFESLGKEREPSKRVSGLTSPRKQHSFGTHNQQTMRDIEDRLVLDLINGNITGTDIEHTAEDLNDPSLIETVLAKAYESFVGDLTLETLALESCSQLHDPSHACNEYLEWACKHLQAEKVVFVRNATRFDSIEDIPQIHDEAIFLGCLALTLGKATILSAQHAYQDICPNTRDAMLVPVDTDTALVAQNRLCDEVSFMTPAWDETSLGEAKRIASLMFAGIPKPRVDAMLSTKRVDQSTQTLYDSATLIEAEYQQVAAQIPFDLSPALEESLGSFVSKVQDICATAFQGSHCTLLLPRKYPLIVENPHISHLKNLPGTDDRKFAFYGHTGSIKRATVSDLEVLLASEKKNKDDNAIDTLMAHEEEHLNASNLTALREVQMKLTRQDSSASTVGPSNMLEEMLMGAEHSNVLLDVMEREGGGDEEWTRINIPGRNSGIYYVQDGVAASSNEWELTYMHPLSQCVLTRTTQVFTDSFHSEICIPIFLDVEMSEEPILGQEQQHQGQQYQEQEKETEEDFSKTTTFLMRKRRSSAVTANAQAASGKILAVLRIESRITKNGRPFQAEDILIGNNIAPVISRLLGQYITHSCDQARYQSLNLSLETGIRQLRRQCCLTSAITTCGEQLTLVDSVETMMGLLFAGMIQVLWNDGNTDQCLVPMQSINKLLHGSENDINFANETQNKPRSAWHVENGNHDKNNHNELEGHTVDIEKLYQDMFQSMEAEEKEKSPELSSFLKLRRLLLGNTEEFPTKGRCVLELIVDGTKQYLFNDLGNDLNHHHHHDKSGEPENANSFYAARIFHSPKPNGGFVEEVEPQNVPIEIQEEEQQESEKVDCASSKMFVDHVTEEVYSEKRCMIVGILDKRKQVWWMARCNKEISECSKHSVEAASVEDVAYYEELVPSLPFVFVYAIPLFGGEYAEDEDEIVGVVKMHFGAENIDFVSGGDINRVRTYHLFHEIKLSGIGQHRWLFQFGRYISKSLATFRKIEKSRMEFQNADRKRMEIIRNLDAGSRDMICQYLHGMEMFRRADLARNMGSGDEMDTIPLGLVASGDLRNFTGNQVIPSRTITNMEIAASERLAEDSFRRHRMDDSMMKSASMDQSNSSDNNRSFFVKLHGRDRKQSLSMREHRRVARSSIRRTDRQNKVVSSLFGESFDLANEEEDRFGSSVMPISGAYLSHVSALIGASRSSVFFAVHETEDGGNCCWVRTYSSDLADQNQWFCVTKSAFESEQKPVDKKGELKEEEGEEEEDEKKKGAQIVNKKSAQECLETEEPITTRRFILIPIIYEGKPSGVIQFEGKGNGDSFQPIDLDLCKAFAELVKPDIELWLDYRKSACQMYKDNLHNYLGIVLNEIRLQNIGLGEVLSPPIRDKMLTKLDSLVTRAVRCERSLILFVSEDPEGKIVLIDKAAFRVLSRSDVDERKSRAILSSREFFTFYPHKTEEEMLVSQLWLSEEFQVVTSNKGDENQLFDDKYSPFKTQSICVIPFIAPKQSSPYAYIILMNRILDPPFFMDPANQPEELRQQTKKDQVVVDFTSADVKLLQDMTNMTKYFLS